ncbi:adult-specific cuticular protein ACP-20-like [Anthonomus grandis grandis]|uniref:adult-specific cuticular protein ACP-20-like n=1 Tax=Anthonomus grandis grandis TaxID=2921223 RepID=UPI00216532C9|nr:adult-specific cuticular protein ACP-20-like [Anthonomus grandis grandis]
MYKLLAVFALIAVVSTQYSPLPYKGHHEEEYGPAKYEFVYVVEDPHTGDFHSQQEQRDGDHVQGQYSLHEADGTVRIVKYSDDGHGFNAVVEKQGHPSEASVTYKKTVVAPAPYNYYHH